MIIHLKKNVKNHSSFMSCSEDVVVQGSLIVFLQLTVNFIKIFVVIAQ